MGSNPITSTVNYIECASCGTQLHKKNFALHKGKEPCQVMTRVRQRKASGWERVVWAYSEMKSAGIPVEVDVVSYTMNGGQLFTAAVEGKWAPAWAVKVASWVAWLSWAPQRTRVGRGAFDGEPYLGERPCYKHHKASREKAFLKRFFKTIMRLPEDERAARTAELEVLGHRDFKDKFLYEIYPHGG
jgi:hypothetical protein